MPQDPNATIRPGFNAFVYTAGNGERWLGITEEVYPNGDVEGRDIPLMGIAARRELLGMGDPIEVVESMVLMQDNGTPECCPVTGRNCYTDPYTILRVRECEREEAALIEEQREGSTKETVQFAARTMAHTSVHQPINGGDCVLNRARAQARAEIGLPEPTSKCWEETRTEPCKLPEEPSVQAMSNTLLPLSPKDYRREAIIQALKGQEGYLLECTQQFLHSLTDNDRDPVTPQPEPEVPETFEELQQRLAEEVLPDGART